MLRTRVCLSIDSETSLPRMVVDGELLVEKKVRLSDQPDNLKLVLGQGKREKSEYPGQITNVNIFSLALSTKQMKLQTKEEEGKCGLEGDFLSWKNLLWEKSGFFTQKLGGSTLAPMELKTPAGPKQKRMFSR